MYRAFLKWMNSFDRKGSLMLSLMGTLAMIIFWIPFLVSGTSMAEWHEDAGGVGMALFYAAHALYVYSLFRIATGKRKK